MEKKAPVFFFAPFVSSTMRIEPAWIDHNGHMNMAYYHAGRVFGITLGH